MTDTTPKRNAELAWTLTKVLQDHQEGLAAKDIIRQIALETPPTEWEQGDYAKGGRRFDWLVRFASIPLVKAGWLVKTKGTWSVTDSGREALRTHGDPASFFKAATRLYREWKKNRLEDAESVGATAPDDAPELAEQTSLEVAEEDAWRGIEHFLRSMQPFELQDLVADLMQAMGYHVGWVAPPGKDGGVDIIAFRDPLGTQSPRVKVQVKRLDRKVDAPEVRAFIAVIGTEDVGVFVNTGGFSRDALDEARRLETRRISLVDLEKLFDLWVEHYDALKDAARQRMPLKPVWFLAPAP